MVGDGYRRHVELAGRFNQVRNPQGSIQKAVFGVDMKMNKRVIHDKRPLLSGQRGTYSHSIVPGGFEVIS